MFKQWEKRLSQSSSCFYARRALTKQRLPFLPVAFRQNCQLPQVDFASTNLAKIRRNRQIRRPDFALTNLTEGRQNRQIHQPYLAFMNLTKSLSPPNRIWQIFAKIVKSMNIHSVWRNFIKSIISLLRAFLNISGQVAPCPSSVSHFSFYGSPPGFLRRPLFHPPSQIHRMAILGRFNFFSSLNLLRDGLYTHSSVQLIVGDNGRPKLKHAENVPHASVLVALWRLADGLRDLPLFCFLFLYFAFLEELLSLPLTAKV